MKVPVENVKIGDRGRDLLIKLKRVTGLEHWNEICRSAFAFSLRDRSLPPPYDPSSEKAVVMDWKVFAGPYNSIYAALLLIRHRHDKESGFTGSVEECLRRHIQRGLGSFDAALDQCRGFKLGTVWRKI